MFFFVFGVPDSESMSTAASSESSKEKEIIHFCNTCQTKLKAPNRCKRCLRVSYCNRTCQRKDWELHKKSCLITNEQLDFAAKFLHAREQSQTKVKASLKKNKNERLAQYMRRMLMGQKNLDWYHFDVTSGEQQSVVDEMSARISAANKDVKQHEEWDMELANDDELSRRFDMFVKIVAGSESLYMIGPSASKNKNIKTNDQTGTGQKF